LWLRSQGYHIEEFRKLGGLESIQVFNIGNEDRVNLAKPIEKERDTRPRRPRPKNQENEWVYTLFQISSSEVGGRWWRV
jgi:hypothetical protein